MTKKGRANNSKPDVQRQTETCQNPFLKKACQGTDIILSIRYNNRDLPICRDCWAEIADGPYEWGEDIMPFTTMNAKSGTNRRSKPFAYVSLHVSALDLKTPLKTNNIREEIR